MAGTITGKDKTDAVFSYAPSFLPYGTPISVHLPLQEVPFSVSATKCFFEGLLPEGFSRKSVASWIHADEDDYLSILAALGKECLGAIQILREGDTAPEEAMYRKLSMNEVKALAAEGATESTRLLVQSHLSLAGASGKVGLYYNKHDHSWYQPMGLAASTHIVKQSHVRLHSMVANEQLALRTAAILGIPVVDSSVISTGSMEDDAVLLSTRRYDRDLPHALTAIDGLPCPLRLHQEDFAQASGIPSEKKYEPEGEHYLKQIFQLVRNHTSNPVQEEKRLLDLLIFDVLIGNTDNHIKNLSLLYSPNLRSLSLAPAYDLVSTIVYRESTTEMSFSIGGEKQWDHIGKETFIHAAPEMGLSSGLVGREYDRLSRAFPSALQKAKDELQGKGFGNAAVIYDVIIEKNQRRLSKTTG